MARNTLTVTINGRQYVTKPANEASKSLSRLGETSERVSKILKVGLAAATALAVKQIVEFGKASVTAASNAEETWNKYSVVFSNVMKEANQAAQLLSDSYGLSSRMAQQMLSDTGDLLTGFGFTQESALSLSKQVNELAVDLASFTNYSGGAEGASVALTKALLGERESIKSLGIAITEADIKQLAEDKGITGNIDRQTKAMLTLELAVNQSKNAIGDFARSEQSLANQQKILRSNLDDLKVNIGNELLPTVTLAVSTFNTWIEKINETSEAVKALSDEIGEDASKGGLKILGSTLGLLVGETGDIVEAIDKLSESAGVSKTYLYNMALSLDFIDEKYKAVIRRILDTRDAIVELKEAFIDNEKVTKGLVTTVDELINEKVALNGLIVEEQRAMNAAIDAADVMGQRYEAMANKIKAMRDPIAELLEFWKKEEEHEAAMAAAEQSGLRYAAMAGGSQYSGSTGTPQALSGLSSFMDSFGSGLIDMISSLDSVVQVLDPMGVILQGVMDVLGPMIDSVLSPILGVLRILGQTIGQVLTPILMYVGEVVTWLAKGFVWLYNKAIMPFGNFLIRMYTMVGNFFIKIINSVIGLINLIPGVNISKMGAIDTSSSQLTAIDMASLTTASGVSGTSYSGGTTGSRTSVQSVNITINQYYDGPVIGEGGIEQVGEYMVRAIRSYTGVGGQTEVITA